MFAGRNMRHTIILQSVQINMYYDNYVSLQLRLPVGEKANYYKTHKNFSVSH
jgi:hypothetical protein